MEALSIEDCREALVELLLEDLCCNSRVEAQAVVDSIEDENCTAAALQENLNVSELQARQLIQRLKYRNATTGVHEDVEDAEEEAGCKMHDDETSDDDEAELLSPGECELCERFILLTKHHLIPKSTWNRLISRPEQFFVTEAALPVAKLTKPNLRAHVAWICRPCHDAIHKYHDNWILATQFNTVDKLLMDEQVYKFCKWAHKQKAGKYKVKGS